MPGTGKDFQVKIPKNMGMTNNTYRKYISMHYIKVNFKFEIKI